MDKLSNDKKPLEKSKITHIFQETRHIFCLVILYPFSDKNQEKV